MYLFGLAECSGYNSGVLRESYRSVGSDIPPPHTHTHATCYISQFNSQKRNEQNAVAPWGSRGETWEICPRLWLPAEEAGVTLCPGDPVRVEKIAKSLQGHYPLMLRLASATHHNIAPIIYVLPSEAQKKYFWTSIFPCPWTWFHSPEAACSSR